MRKVKKIKQVKKVKSIRTRKNPTTWTVKKVLTPEELSTLSYISARYDSANHLLNAYNEDIGEWDMNIVARGFIATLEDGGARFQVPLAGGSLKSKIDFLFTKILENSEKLDMNTQIELEEAGI